MPLPASATIVSGRTGSSRSSPVSSRSRVARHGEQPRRLRIDGGRGLRGRPQRLLADGVQAVRAGHTGGAGAAHLHAVVAGRIVAGRHHEAGRVPRPGGEVQLIGRAQALEADVQTARHDTGGGAFGEPWRIRAHVTPHDDLGRAVRTEDARRAVAQCEEEVVVQLVAHGAAQVVGPQHPVEARATVQGRLRGADGCRHSPLPETMRR